MLAASKKRAIIKPVTHVVQQGDTLSKIAHQYHNVTYQEIAQANGLSNPNNIHVGQHLKIPKQTLTDKTPAPKPNPHRKPIPDATSTGRNKGSGCEKCEIDEEYFFRHCGGKSATKARIKKMFKAINSYYKKAGRDCNLKQIAYMLATAKHETANTFKPITEYGGKSYFNRYDPVLANSDSRRKRAIKMGNTKKGDGYKYRGRGFVQLTWKSNYKKAGDFLGIDLVNNPELALDYENAMKIMIYGMEKGIFTGKRLSNYITKSKSNYYDARKIINGHDKVSTIKKYALEFEKCLRRKHAKNN